MCRGHNITNVEIMYSNNQNIYYNAVKGKIFIHNSIFRDAVNSKGDNYFAGNAFFFSECNNQNTIFSIKHTQFLNNTNNQSRQGMHLKSDSNLDFASGLLIVLKCTIINVSLDNITLDGNSGVRGGNLALVFHNLSDVFASPVYIQNSFIRNGKANIGGGMLIQLVEASLLMNQHCKARTKARTLLVINNTEFTRNKATYGGGGLYLQTKESQTYCSAAKINITNCIFKSNTLSTKGTGGLAIHNTNFIAFPYVEHAQPQFHLNIVKCSFSGHHVDLHRRNSGTGVIAAEASPSVHLTDLSIYNNECSGILGISSSFIISGNVNIFNNNASSGGGMLFCSDSVMFLTPHTILTITNNFAEHAGGGICVEIQCLQSQPICFFQLDTETSMHYDEISSINVSLHNNSAGYAGHELYGGSIEYCFLLESPFHNVSANKSEIVFEQIFDYDRSKPSSITSPPHRVCLCNKKKNLTVL